MNLIYRNSRNELGSDFENLNGRNFLIYDGMPKRNFPFTFENSIDCRGLFFPNEQVSLDESQILLDENFANDSIEKYKNFKLQENGNPNLIIYSSHRIATIGIGLEVFCSDSPLIEPCLNGVFGKGRRTDISGEDRINMIRDAVSVFTLFQKVVRKEREANLLTGLNALYAYKLGL